MTINRYDDKEEKILELQSKLMPKETYLIKTKANRYIFVPLKNKECKTYYKMNWHKTKIIIIIKKR